MNGYYQRPFGPESGENMMGLVGQDGMDASGMMGVQSLDDIVNNNTKAMRRRSVPVHYGNNPGTMDNADMRRVSMMDFSGAAPGGSLNGFAFAPSSNPGMDGVMRSDGPYQVSNSAAQERRQSASNLALNTRFSNHQGSPYTSMPPSGSSFASPLAPNISMDIGMTSPYDASSMPIPLDMTDPSLDTMMGNNMPPMDIFQPPQFASPLMDSPMNPEFAASIRGQPHDVETNVDLKDQFPGSIPGSVPASDTTSMTPEGPPSRTNSQEQSIHPNSRPQSTGMTPRSSSSHVTNANYAPEAPPKMTETQHGKFPWATPPGGFPSTLHGRPHMESQFKNIYSSSGFDMLGVLMRVATRPNPEINIGSVDMSCAFVVCDAEADDFPIVYCSENFERLTGYTKHMIIGRNCRFLQAPDGRVEPGIKRKYVDDESVLYLKNMVHMRREAQISLINYRRGGQPFMNLLTMIPICWDTDQVRYFVGFQVDLVEQPNAVQNRNPDGSYSINYQRGLTMPGYVLNTPDRNVQPEYGQTIPRDEVSNVLASFAQATDSDLTKRVWDKVLLENTDDVVHVLSLKGLFMYLSPSSRKVLEYDPSELVGTALSSVCHPSDIVPVTRELKDTSNGSAVNVVFRIRRKHNGYMWFEGHGSLHTEQGKGRKCIIMVGRERPVYTLNKSDIIASGGIGDNELWTKMSTSGMFLFVSSNVRQLLDRQPDEMVGTSIQALMRQDSKQEFGRILGLARTGKKASVKHEMINKRGQVLQAFTTIYPGDAVEGQKPTFVVAQTRLLKFSRSANQGGQRPTIYPKQERDSQGSMGSTASGSNSNATGTSLSIHGGDHTPKSSISGNQYISTTGSATTFSGHNALEIGHQDASLASEENVFEELKTTRSSSWQYELRQMEKRNRLLAEEVQSLLAAKKKRKRRKGAGQLQKDCANCHTKVTPEWRRGPSGNRDLCNSCGLRWAKQNGRVSPRTSSQHSVSGKSDKASLSGKSPRHAQPILPNSNEAGQSAIPSAVAPGEKRSSSQQANTDSHAAKVARMEVAASQGLSGGIPPKIDEGVEPD